MAHAGSTAAAAAAAQIEDGRVGMVAPLATRSICVRAADREGLVIEAFEDIGCLHEAFPDKHPTVVAVWIEDPSSHLTRTISPLQQRYPGAKIVLISPSIGPRDVRAALAAGVAGVVHESQCDRTFGPCVRAVQSGQTCVPQGYSRQIQPASLSSREKQVLGLVVMGYMNGQIAERLYLAESTVKSHLSSAFSKLGVRSRNEAVSLILDPERGLGMGILAIGGEPL